MSKSNNVTFWQINVKKEKILKATREKRYMPVKKQTDSRLLINNDDWQKTKEKNLHKAERK